MGFFKVPLTNSPDQSFETTLNINGQNKNLGLRIRYNVIEKYWWLSVSDAETNELKIDNIVLYCGHLKSNDLLKPYAYLGLGSLFLMPKTDYNPVYPKEDNLKSEYLLIWGDTLDN